MVGGSCCSASSAGSASTPSSPGEGRTPWLALAALILVVPLVVAFTLRPAVFANEERLRIRNPFRVIVLPWGEVATLRSGYSNEVVAHVRRQVPAVGRSRSRCGAARRRRGARRAGGSEAAGRAVGRSAGGLTGGGFRRTGRRHAGPRRRGRRSRTGPSRPRPTRSWTTCASCRRPAAKAEAAQGEVTVRWAYEIAAPAVAGAVLLAILIVIG